DRGRHPHAVDLGQADVAAGAIPGRTIRERSIAGPTALGRADADEKHAAAGALREFSHVVTLVSTGAGEPRPYFSVALAACLGRGLLSAGMTVAALSLRYAMLIGSSPPYHMPSAFRNDLSAPMGSPFPFDGRNPRPRSRATHGRTEALTSLKHGWAFAALPPAYTTVVGRKFRPGHRRQLRSELSVSCCRRSWAGGGCPRRSCRPDREGCGSRPKHRPERKSPCRATSGCRGTG